MHILIAGHLFPTPANPTLGVFVLERARALTRQNKVTVLSLISFFPLVRPRPGCPASENHADLTIHRAFYWTLPRILFAWRWQTMAATVRKATVNLPRPDIVHIDWVYPDARAIIQWACSHNIPSVITVHGRNALGSDLPKSYYPLYAWPLEHCDRIITVSHDLKQQILARFPKIQTGKVTVIPNGVDPVRFKPMSRQEARKKLGLPQDAKLIVNVARLSQEKAQDVLIQAAACCQTGNLQVQIVGDGPLRATLQDLINQIEVREKVHLVGQVDHSRIPLWLAAADVFCLPSWHEGSPVTLYEALACGIPVVASRVGGIPELVNMPEHGILVPPGDPAALAAALDQALNTTWDSAALSAYGQSFTWDSITNQTMTIYQELNKSSKQSHE